MKNGDIAYLAFTEKGRALARRLCAALGGEVSCTRDGVSLDEWTAKAFSESRALVFVGAAGIAVRTVAPSAFHVIFPVYVPGSTSAPAVTLIQNGCVSFAGAGPPATGSIGSGHQPLHPSEEPPFRG